MQDLLIGESTTAAVNTAKKLKSCVVSAVVATSTASTILMSDRGEDDVDRAESVVGANLLTANDDAVMDWIRRDSHFAAQDSLDLEVERGHSPADSVAEASQASTSLPRLQPTSTRTSFHSARSSISVLPVGIVTQAQPAPQHTAVADPDGSVAETDGPRHERVQISRGEVETQSDGQAIQDTASLAANTTPREPLEKDNDVVGLARKPSRLSRLMLHLRRPSSSKPKPQSTQKPKPLYSGARLRRKLCFIGDGACGKTCLIILASKGVFPEVYVPTIFENYVANGVAFEENVELGLWDTAGQDDYNRLRPLSYPDTDVMVICFSIGSPDSLDNVYTGWRSEVGTHCAWVSVILVGCQQDRRHDPQHIGNLLRNNQRPVTTEKGFKVANSLNAVMYLETSAKTQYGTENIMNYLAEEAVSRGARWDKKEKKMKDRRDPASWCYKYLVDAYWHDTGHHDLFMRGEGPVQHRYVPLNEERSAWRRED